MVNIKNREIAKQIFKRLQFLYPYLTMEINENVPHLEVCMKIQKQEGMKFEINLNLQNTDELHLSSGKLWMSWFPCTEQENVEDYFDVIRGLIDGKYRILETIKGEKVTNAKLQKPVNGEWESKSSGMITFKLPSFKKKTYNVVQNI